MAVYLYIFIYVFVYLFKTNPGVYRYLWVAYKFFWISLITQLTHRLKQPTEKDFVSKNGQNRLKNGETAFLAIFGIFFSSSRHVTEKIQ